VISTVNGGDLTAEGIGRFDIRNVNGGIRMTGITGSGSVHTVNGPVTVHFARNPTEQCDFKTVNGGIDAGSLERAMQQKRCIRIIFCHQRFWKWHNS